MDEVARRQVAPSPEPSPMEVGVDGRASAATGRGRFTAAGRPSQQAGKVRALGPVAGEGPVGIGLAGGGDRQAAPAVSSGTPPLEAARQNPPSPPPLAHQPGLTGASPQPCRHAFQAPPGGLWATPDCRQEALVLR